MRSHFSVAIVLFISMLPVSSPKAWSQTSTKNYETDVVSIDAIIRAYYEVVSGPKGRKRDWERDHFLHHPSAKIWVTNTNHPGNSNIRAMTLSEFHKSSSGLVNTGFFEREIGRQVLQFGNITHIWSAYEWSIEQDGKIGGRGINSIELYHDGSRYWILSWVYDSERPDNPIPGEYKKFAGTLSKGAYLGQDPPGEEPELFAPGVISTGMHEHSSPVFSPDGKEIYWSVFFEFRGPQKILWMKQENGVWSAPEVAPFSTHFKDGNPFISPDGSRLYFESMRPIHEDDSARSDYDLWFVDRTEVGWGMPVHMAEINSGAHDRGVSVANDGTLYFSSARDGGYGNSDIYRSEPDNGQYKVVHNLGTTVNSPGYESWPYIAPDESYILYEKSHISATGVKGINISFKRRDGWTAPAGLGEMINKSGQNRFPMLSPDGEYLFFVSSRALTKAPLTQQPDYESLIEESNKPGNGWGDVYWIDSSFILNFKNRD